MVYTVTGLDSAFDRADCRPPNIADVRVVNITVGPVGYSAGRRLGRGTSRNHTLQTRMQILNRNLEKVSSGKVICA
jgi:hypothetical protein